MLVVKSQVAGGSYQPLRYVSRLSRGSGSIQKYVPFVITKKKKHKNLGKKIYVKQLNT